MDFCKRMGINIREEMQIDSLDQKTKNLLYNIIMQVLPRASMFRLTKELSFFVAYMLNEKIDKDIELDVAVIEEIVNKFDYSYTYELIEIIHSCVDYNVEDSKIRNHFRNWINNILDFEKCNYRMGSDGKFIKCCCDEEFDNINEALNTDINPVKTHLEKAVKAYSARGEKINNTEVCNEAIKAVEALARKKLGDEYKTKTLGQCIDPLMQKLNIPSFVINTIEKIWVALNSPETGVRHAGREDGSIIGEPEAYFILITCCSFINYVDKKVL